MNQLVNDDINITLETLTTGKLKSTTHIKGAIVETAFVVFTTGDCVELRNRRKEYVDGNLVYEEAVYND